MSAPEPASAGPETHVCCSPTCKWRPPSPAREPEGDEKLIEDALLGIAVAYGIDQNDPDDSGQDEAIAILSRLLRDAQIAAHEAIQEMVLKGAEPMPTDDAALAAMDSVDYGYRSAVRDIAREVGERIKKLRESR